MPCPLSKPPDRIRGRPAPNIEHGIQFGWFLSLRGYVDEWVSPISKVLLRAFTGMEKWIYIRVFGVGIVITPSTTATYYLHYLNSSGSWSIPNASIKNLIICGVGFSLSFLMSASVATRPAVSSGVSEVGVGGN